MASSITNIKAYSENTGLDVLAALKGEYEQLDSVHHVSIFKPYETPHGGLQIGSAYTLAYDMNGSPHTLKNMTYEGVSIEENHRFAG
jgi:hypothetical protein